MRARVNRRQFERFMLEPGYTGALARVHPEEEVFVREGHVYDISEGGVCFERFRTTVKPLHSHAVAEG